MAFRAQNDQSVAELSKWLKASPSAGSPLTFSATMLDGLPEPVQRYFLHAIRPGTAVAAGAELKITGQFRLKADGVWLPMRSEQILAPPRGFVWQASIGRLLRFSGYDSYNAETGTGAMRWWLWGLIPIVNADGPEISRSSAGRLAIESVLVPSALLRGVAWTALDENTIQARLGWAEGAVLTLKIGPYGRLERAEMLRWGTPGADKRFVEAPFVVENIEEEGTFGGYTVPTRFRAGWRVPGEAPFDFFAPLVELARYF